jgi:hypothetical protein
LLSLTTSKYSVSVQTLLETLANLKVKNSFSRTGQLRVNNTRFKDHSSFNNEHSELFLYQYEDLVNCNLEGLEYLRMTLQEGEASVGAELQRVRRTKT